MQYQHLAHFRKPPAGRSQRVGLVKRHGVRAVHGAEGRGWRQASGGSQRDWCTREAPDGRGPRTSSHSLTHNFRNHPPGAWGRVRGGAVRGVRGGCVVSRVGPSGWNCTLFTPRCDIIVADDYHGSINWRGRAKHCAGCAGRVLAVRGVGRARWLSDIIEISTPDNARVQGPRENNADLTSSSAVAWGKSAYVWRENARARLASTLAAGIRLGHGGKRCARVEWRLRANVGA